jgi:hypothetical protein
MTKRERVTAALRGEPVDRVPVAFWLHNFATENSAEGLATETLRLARTFDWDFLKPQSRAQCFAEIGELYAGELNDKEQAVVAFAQAFCEDPLEEERARAVERAAGGNAKAWAEVLESQGKGQLFEIFRRYDLERPLDGQLTYDDLASELGIDVTAVTNRLASARREFRRIILAKLRALTANDEEYRDEVRAVLGTDVS